VGEGNAARRLRVVGDDADGRRGVYETRLADAAWSFRVVDLEVPDDAWLNPHDNAALPTPRVAMRGRLRGHASLGHVSASTDDFWSVCSPFSLTLTVGQEDVPLTVHTVDAWTLFAQPGPLDAPSSYRSMKATLMLDRQVERSLSVRTRAHLQQLFGSGSTSALGRPFAFAAVANAEELVLAPVGYPFNAGRSRYEIVLRAGARQRAHRVAASTPATELARTLIDLERVADHRACAADAALRQKAERVQHMLLAAADEREQRARLASTLEVVAPIPLLPIDAFTVVTAVRFFVPTLSFLVGLEMHMPAVLAAQQMAWDRAARSGRADVDRVSMLLSRCARATQHLQPSL
jgi:hypothetical protein